MIRSTSNEKLAIWAITPNGARLALRLADDIGPADLHLSASLAAAVARALPFERLADAVSASFDRYRRHVFIMSTGIVVRVIAGCLRRKTVDPAVVVVDEAGRHAISLLSGHLGGANRLAAAVADAVGGVPVITTATDVNQLPAIDVIAQQRNLRIENPEAIKHVNMALLTGAPIVVHDPYAFLEGTLPPGPTTLTAEPEADLAPGAAGVSVADTRRALGDRWLRLRPPILAAGMGCNRNTPADEMRDLLARVLEASRLVVGSLTCLATIDIKRDEPGLIALAAELAVPLKLYSKQELNRVRGVASPSAMVKKHVGVESVCEAAAILATDNGSLIVSKQRTRNVTLAIARKAFTS